MENWKKYKADNGLDESKKSTKVYVTMVTRAALQGGDPRDFTPAYVFFYLTCQFVSLTGPRDMKSSEFYNSKDKQCGFSDCHRNQSCNGFGGEATGHSCRTAECSGRPLCGWAWESRYECCKKKGIEVKTTLKNVNPRHCYTFLVDLEVGIKGTYCTIPRVSQFCKIDEVTGVKPTICLPSNQTTGSPDTSECKFFFDVESKTETKDFMYGKICDLYPQLLACSCINAESLPEYKELVKLPQFQGADKRCFWRSCQNTSGPILLREIDKLKDQTCRTIYCGNYINMEGLTQNQLDNLNQNVKCDINDTDQGSGGNVIDRTTPPATGGGDGSGGVPTSPGGDFNFGGDDSNGSTEEASDNTMYLVGGAVVVLALLGGAGFMLYKSSQGSKKNKK